MINLRFDFRLAPESPASMGELYSAALEMVSWGEDLGVCQTLFSQHHASSDGYLPSPMLLASAAASRTQNMPISIGALLLLMYDPIKLAEDMAVLDHLSQGRVSYIIGLGYRDEEYSMFGIDPKGRGKTIEEYMDVLKRALAGDQFTWRGRQVNVRPGPFTPGGPVLCYGGGSPAAARRAARYGMMFIPQSANPTLQEIYDEEATRCGNPTGMYAVTPKGAPNSLFVAEDLDKAWQEIGPYMLHDAKMYAQWMGADTMKTSTYSGALTVEALRAENGSYRIVTPEQAVELVNQFGYLGLQPLSGGVPPELAWPSLKLIEQKVLPVVKS